MIRGIIAYQSEEELEKTLHFPTDLGRSFWLSNGTYQKPKLKTIHIKWDSDFALEDLNTADFDVS